MAFIGRLSGHFYNESVYVYNLMTQTSPMTGHIIMRGVEIIW